MIVEFVASVDDHDDDKVVGVLGPLSALLGKIKKQSYRKQTKLATRRWKK